MLIHFSVENFRSIHGEQTLNMVASKAQSGHEDHCVEIPTTSERALRACAIYGANAAGKSNFVKAMRFAQDLLLERLNVSHRIPIVPFKFVEDAANPSTFEFRFATGERVFTYGFDVGASAVSREWLACTDENGSENDVFDRQKEGIEIGDPALLGSSASDSVQALKLLKQLGVRPNQLLLSKVIDLDDATRGSLLNDVSKWFTHSLRIILPEASYLRILELLDQNEDAREFFATFFDRVGTGISDLTVNRRSVSADSVPSEWLEHLQGDSEEDPVQSVLFDTPVMTLQVDPESPGKLVRRNLLSGHSLGSGSYPLSFDQESDGTQRLLQLLPALYFLHEGERVFVIDEIDRSLHPHLSRAFVSHFLSACSEGTRQLIVTTHDTGLLDQDLLRRDEIWFVEKDEAQSSQFYSLADFSNVRKDLRLERSYLNGRFGAVPSIWGLDDRCVGGTGDGDR